MTPGLLAAGCAVARLTAFSGTLYGTTKDGGTNHSGTVFAITP
jgi:uncharacterized repeat protein (TIGR03803 family)